MNIEEVFSNLWKKYIFLAPKANEIHKMFQGTQKIKIINDHIALRTLNFDTCNIDKLYKVFVTLGYVKKDYYYFENKKLQAYHFEHENTNYPKVFISQLQVEKFDHKTQDILKSLKNSIPTKILESNSLVYSSKHWDISYDTYNYLYQKSEYAAWFYVFGFTANHFTILINKLEKFNDIEEVNKFVKENGFSLNYSGGEIKGSKELLLQQSSTIAQKIDVKFKEGIYSIPSCFYEFAKRHEDKNQNLYQGFIEKSADLIFQSTDNN